MARGTGTANLAASLEVLAGAPLDARTVVPTVADLTTAANFPYKYVGLPVVVQATGDLYILTGNDVTVETNWKKVGDVGPVGSDNVVEGYYNSTDHLFYEESTYTTAITGESEVIYVALDTNKTYRYNGLIFVRLDEESGGGGGGHTIVDEVGNDMTPENKLQFTYGLKVQDVSENLTTQVIADEMEAADMAEVIPSLPGVMARSVYNNRFNRSDLYSTDEVLIGKWTDGKPLYQKTFIKDSSISKDAWNTVGVVPNAEKCISISGMFLLENSSYYAIGQYRNSDMYTMADFNTSNNSVEVYISSYSGYTINEIITIVQYTKATDGVCNVNFDKDYSTDETLVGRWIDGKPLYQKTVQFNENYSTSGSGIKYIQFDTGIIADVIASQEGYFTLDGKKVSIGSTEFNWSGGNSFMSYVLMRSNGHVYLYISHTNDYSDTSAQGYVTVRYTKSS